jgi:phosphonate C-P lyase system protein PhnG
MSSGSWKNTAERPVDPADLMMGLSAALPGVEPGRVAAVLDRLWASGAFAVHRPPFKGLLMCPVRDPFDTEFFLGEVLVTTAEVRCAGAAGHGVIIGDEAEKALLLAAVDAAVAGGRPELLEVLIPAFAEWSQEEAERRRLESKSAAATRVLFESMKKERVDFGSLG